MTIKPSKQCPAPWTSLILSAGTYGPCCLYRLENEAHLYPRTEPELLAVFNSEKMKELRQRLVDGNVAGTPCEKCLVRSEEFNVVDLSDEFRETPLFGKWKNAYTNKKVELDYVPLSMSMGTSPKCNLRCIMCVSNDQTTDTDIYNRDFFPGDEFRALLDGCEGVGRLSFSGGEPFLDKDFLKFLEGAIEEYEDCTFHIVTNGFYLKKYMDLISRIKNLDLMVSIDGFEESYEKIRKGGTWAALNGNLLALKDVADTKNRWKVRVNSLVMKTSLPDLGRLIGYVASLGFSHQFSAIRGNLPEENIFSFTRLFDEIPDWLSHMDKAVEAMQGVNKKQAKVLAHMKAEMARVSKGKVRQQISGNTDLIDEQMRSLKELQAREPGCNLMGTPKHLQLFSEYKDFFVGLYDPQISSQGETPYGVPAIDFETMKQSELPVLCGFPTFRYKEFKDALREIEPERKRHLPFFADGIEQNIKAFLSSYDQGKACVLYGTGGMAEVLLDFYGFRDLNIKAFSDTDPKKWGKEFEGRPIVSPEDIPEQSVDVIILSDQYQLQIKKHLISLHGETLNLHTLA